MLGRTVSLMATGLLAVGLLAPASHAATADQTAALRTTPVDALRVFEARHRVVPVDRWSWVALHVYLRDPAERVLVRATGPDLRTRKVVLHDVDEGRSWIRVPVRLTVPRDRLLTTRVRADFGEDRDPAAAMLRVRIEPRR